MRDGQKRDAARRLRVAQTDVERAMWRLLRHRQLENLKFRRQVPIGPFVVDFACLAQRLVVELDGGQHAESASDAQRDAFLATRGWRVLRFWNNEMSENPDGVLWAIMQAAGVGPETP